MSMNREGRPTRPEGVEASGGTWTGNRALMLEEPLIFEMGEEDGTGVDFDSLPLRGEVESGNCAVSSTPPLPTLSPPAGGGDK